MGQRNSFTNLTGLAQLVLDVRLNDLSKAASVIEDTRGALERLDQMPEQGGDLPDAVAALAGLSYQRWADARRAELNRQLAQQTHDWMVLRDQAREAFGRAEALKAVTERLKRRQLS